MGKRFVEQRSLKALVCITGIVNRILPLVRVTIAIMKHHDQKQDEDERVYLTSASSSIS